MNSSRCRRTFIVAVLLTHVGLLMVSSRLHFATIDETGHIPAGLHHWTHGTFELYRVNPPLPRMLATLPLLFTGANSDLGELRDAPGRRLEWTANWEFAENNQARYVELVRLARLAGIAWSLLGAWVVIRWSKDLFGPNAALLALVLWCFGPNILAHAQLVTPDIPCTVSGLAACYIFRAYLRRPAWSTAWFAGLLLGVALLTKITWLLLFGLWPVLCVLYLGPKLVTLGRLAKRFGQGSMIAGLSLLILNLGYGFQGACRPLGEYAFVSRAFAR